MKATPPAIDVDTRKLYRNRFSERQRDDRARLWTVLFDSFLVRYIPSDAVVMDFGSGDCLFINAVRARRRIAVDINPDIEEAADHGVEIHVGGMKTGDFAGECDVVMASNVFEHLRSANHLLETLDACRSALKPGGRLIVLQPNFRYAYRNFYDYLDHTLPLTHEGLIEALEMSGFEVDEVHPRFLPYSAKRQGLDQSWMLRLYLRLRPLWRVFGRQMLIVATTAR